MERDVIIIGSGIAGLSLAIKLHELNAELNILVLSKSDVLECNTRYAQGGIAAVTNMLNDSFENHIHDTLTCGRGLCDPKVVRMVVEQAPERIHDLINIGTKFDTKDNQQFHLALEGGHSLPRVVHHKDKTGFEVERSLLKRIKQIKKIQLQSHITVVDLDIETRGTKKQCVGVKILDATNEQLIEIPARITVLASGGCGQVYANTTNPIVATGDGYAMASRAGVQLKHMRFMQFHPTALYEAKNHAVSFLISEALRGFGAHVVDGNEKRFLFLYDSRGELATRDVISSAINDYMQTKGLDFVYMDLRHLDIKLCKKEFPQIFEAIAHAGYNPAFDLIPITPSAHYQCGGVVVNKHAQSSIKQLYALGEVSHTGLHGANRLASNSLLEALVYAHNASKHIANALLKRKKTLREKSILDINIDEDKELLTKIFQLKKHMTAFAFNRDENNIQKTKALLTILLEESELRISKNHYSLNLLNLRNMAKTASLIIEDSIAQGQDKTSKTEKLAY